MLPIQWKAGWSQSQLDVVSRGKYFALGGIQIPDFPPHNLIIILTMLSLLLQLFGFHG